MEPELVIVNKQNKIATVVLNRPDQRNAIDARMAESIALAFEGLKNDNIIY
jgi:enoyl-CoA hydratase/carnithine racemase